MKMILTIIVTLALSSVASAQLIYSSVKVGVEAATPCPPDWTRTNETVVSPALFYIHVPVSLGGRIFLVTSSLVDALWSTDAAKAAAVVSGILEIQDQSAVTKSYCALVP